MCGDKSSKKRPLTKGSASIESPVSPFGGIGQSGKKRRVESDEQEQSLGGFHIGRPRPGFSRRRRMLKRRGFSSFDSRTRRAAKQQSHSFNRNETGSQFFSNIPGFFDNLSTTKTTTATSRSSTTPTTTPNLFGTCEFLNNIKNESNNAQSENHFPSDQSASRAPVSTWGDGYPPASGSNNGQHTHNIDPKRDKNSPVPTKRVTKVTESNHALSKDQKNVTNMTRVYQDEDVAETINVRDLAKQIPRTPSPNDAVWLEKMLDSLQTLQCPPKYPLWMQDLLYKL
jgi:hypothetical protein